ncbi:hypothetical protein [Pantoea stewartii]|uniref:hypothetical protein n=1 Tax=Pantoea stewartii TaxID=66269 RepID=UPI00162A38BD|nr:hypothetical protein [Pantoea stewartii]MBC0853850.1 hypothetical protein [Pantoea stewartii]
MDFMSGVAAAKQALELLKVIKESRDESVIRKAAGDLSEKITDLQMLNAELSGLYQSEREVTVKLREENAKIEMFAVKSENYELHTTEGGSTVYRSKTSSDEVVNPHYLCAHCYSNKIISILQPSTVTIQSAGFYVHYCPQCKNEFRINPVPPMKPVYMPPARSW